MYVGQIKLSLEACLDGANGSSHGDVVLIVVYLRERIATGYALLQDGRVVQCAPNLLDRQRQRLLASKVPVLKWNLWILTALPPGCWKAASSILRSATRLSCITASFSNGCSPKITPALSGRVTLASATPYPSSSFWMKNISP